MARAEIIPHTSDSWLHKAQGKVDQLISLFKIKFIFFRELNKLNAIAYVVLTKNI